MIVIYQPHHSSLARDQLQLPPLIPTIPIAWHIGNSRRAIGKPSADAPACVGTIFFAFILIHAGINGQEPDRLGVVEINLLHFKVHIYTQLLQFITGVQKLEYIPA